MPISVDKFMVTKRNCHTGLTVLSCMTFLLLGCTKSDIVLTSPPAPLVVGTTVAIDGGIVSPTGLTVFGNRLFFAANDGIHGVELFALNGTTMSISLIVDINSSGDSSNPAGMTSFKSKLYFTADDGSTGRELWVYDGSHPATRVADIFPGATGSNPTSLAVFNGKLFFAADDGVNGRELWSYDGSNAPALVVDLNPGAASASPRGMVLYNGKLYFAADDGSHGVKVWAWNSVSPDIITTSCTPIIANENTLYQDNQDGMYFYVFAGKLYFPGIGVSVQCEPYCYDSNNESLSLLKDININDAGSNKSSNPVFFVSFNNLLYFTATDGGTAGVGHGPELWVSDGTTAHTKLAIDIEQGPVGASGGRPSDTLVYKGKLLFDNYEHYDRGRELYAYDGITALLVADINKFGGSNPDDLVVFGDSVYFAASDGTHGRQLWKYTE